MVSNLSSINESELSNDIVTVTKLQVALRSEARSLQATLSDLGLKADTTTSEGLFQLLRQTATALLDHAAYWTHVLSSSETLYNREAAETRFTELSLQERSKFSVESLSNVNGVVSTQPIEPPEPNETSAYVVVTLLLGTENDNPLFGDIYTTSVLRDVLENITMMVPRYLLVFELLWSPQESKDSLTEAELATEYKELVAIG
ncbi:MAG TPA: DUF1517 domain-containing protein [Thermosynechococcaceae cyanobacterium]